MCAVCVTTYLMQAYKVSELIFISKDKKTQKQSGCTTNSCKMFWFLVLEEKNTFCVLILILKGFVSYRVTGLLFFLLLLL